MTWHFERKEPRGALLRPRLHPTPKHFIIMQTENLTLLRSLRTQEKAIKARIDEISTEATNEAVAILADKEPDEIKLTVKVIE